MTREEALKLVRDKVEELARLDQEDIEDIVDIIYDDFDMQTKAKQAIVQVPNEYTNINQEAFNEWMAYKKYKNKVGITKTLNFLSKYDFETQQQIVDTSIMNNYKGLFEPKQKRSNTQNNVNAVHEWLIDTASDEQVIKHVE